MRKSKRILIINGVNLNMLGFREPEQYGTITLKELEKDLHAYSFGLGIDIETFQSNIEGEIVEKIHESREHFDGIILNAGAYTHTSIAILDATKAVHIPTVEVHISDVDEREEFRKHSFVSLIALETIKGKGFGGYLMAIDFLKNYITDEKSAD